MAQGSGSPVGSELPTGHAETILVVDDDSGVRDIVARILQRCGYRVLVASDGLAALAIARSYDGEIALLLTDVLMPVMSGPELAAQIRAERRRIRVLFMSGYADAVLGERGLSSDPVALLAKPFAPVILARAVRAVLDAA